MTRFDYDTSRDIARRSPSFDALIMAAMRRADPGDLARLIVAFPTQWRQYDARRNAERLTAEEATV